MKQRVTPRLAFPENPIVALRGTVGTAAQDIAARLRQEPFSSLAWLRADVTGETVSEFDDVEEHTWHRPFKNFSGDISGRFLEAMALAAPEGRPTEMLDQLARELVEHQNPDGSFAAFGPIDWQQPIDHGNLFKVKMMPALWGNSRLLCGLVEGARALDNEALLQSAKRLGGFYHSVLPRFTDRGRMDEYTDGGTFAAGYVTCYFPAMEGLLKLYQLCGEQKYLDTAVQMATFYAGFDKIPIDHSHGMLCCHVGLLLIYEATGEVDYLQRVENRWDELVGGGYINPAGGILEKCRPVGHRDEGCALVDWLRLNLELARLTGKGRYLAMAERVLLNHLLQNQCRNGGFGHRNSIKDEFGLIGFTDQYEEATWCCCFHGMLGFELLKNTLCMVETDTVRLSLALDFEVSACGLHIDSSLSTSDVDGEILRQTVSLDQPGRVSIRRPGWAEDVLALDDTGKTLMVFEEDGWLSTRDPVERVTWIYRGGEVQEPRFTGDHPAASQVFTYRGPWLLGKIEGDDPMPLCEKTRDRNVLFWGPSGIA